MYSYTMMLFHKIRNTRLNSYAPFNLDERETFIIQNYDKLIDGNNILNASYHKTERKYNCYLIKMVKNFTKWEYSCGLFAFDIFFEPGCLQESINEFQ